MRGTSAQPWKKVTRASLLAALLSPPSVFPVPMFAIAAQPVFRVDPP